MIKTLTVLLLISFSTITLADSGKRIKVHFYDKPYECLYTKTVKKSGKKYTSLYYFHPEKSWKIKLSKANKNFSIKIALFDTSEGRYAGNYKGVYPDINKIKFSSFLPNKNNSTNKPSSKINKDNCQLIKDLSVFTLPDVKSLICMDNKKTGACESLMKS